jgi:hypothetical protein
MDQVVWTDEFRNNNINKNWSKFIKHYESASDQSIPKSNSSAKSKNHWLSPELKQLTKNKNTMYRNHSHSGWPCANSKVEYNKMKLDIAKKRNKP